MNVLGFVYVNVSNMNWSRRSLFFSNHENRRDFFLTVIFAPIFFFLGNNVCLRGQQDLSGLEKPETYAYWDCVLYNFCLWTLAFIFGL